MMPPKQRRPDLDHCVQILQSLSKDIHTKPPKGVGEIYVAAVGLLYHLKLDQVALQEIRKQADGKSSVPFPKSNAIPAITAVVHNQQLFQALVSCLSSSPADMESEARSFGVNMNRKRTHSISDTPDISSKSLKISHSPNVGKRTFAYGRPQINVKVLAATILYISFEHLDHWPVPLMKAYSEDCFGPRSWVDEPACQLLVRNLALSHTAGCDSDTPDLKNEADALAVADFFRVKETLPAPPETTAQSPVRQRQRGSVSSITSYSSTVNTPTPVTRPRSMSTDSFDSLKPSGALKKPKIITATSKMPSIGTMNDDDSDSGEEEEVAVTITTGKKSDDGDSSSSGEEDEEVVVGANKAGDDDSSTMTSPNSSKPTDQPPQLKLTYPYSQEHFNFDKVRQRYFGINLDQAHHAISLSLNERLDVKSKHNSGLLQTLPLFAAIPQVRSLITANLEKWLQSPALAGLGRSLFSTTVGMMKNVDPPLPADLEAIDNILSMKLKVNQFNAHVENVTAIAAKIPTSAVSHHIFSHLLRELALSVDSPDATSSDHLKMINAVYNELPNNLAAKGIAAALLSLLADRPASLDGVDTPRLVKRLLSMIRSISKQLGGAFDSCQLLDSLLENKVRSDDWTANDEENKARLMYQCVTLLVEKYSSPDRKIQAQGPSVKRTESSPQNIEAMRTDLMRARKILLGWCCSEYAPLCSQRKNGLSNGKTAKDAVVGAGVADYSSILDGLESQNDNPQWLETMRCVLFLEGPESPSLRRFLSPSGNVPGGDADWQKEASRIVQCCEIGSDVDDEMVWTVLKSTNSNTGMSAEMALTLLEHMFHGCNKSKKAKLLVQEADLLDELYKLVEYIPPKPVSSTDDGRKDADGNSSAKGDDNITKAAKSSTNGTKTIGDARLAYPGMWWRVTSLALVMCGSAPDSIGMVAWKDYPTLRALMKMVTSDRYRFPTVDCDDASRDEMKKTEQSMRDEEAKITELLFLPKKAKKKKKDNHTAEASYGGSRASRRQQEKREKMLQKQKEKEKAEAQAEAHRRKKLLRAAQKSIMLWDPRNGARKPPRESADLIFAVGESFDLPKTFQRSVKPDFLLMTIGNTTRGAIERAYDWLIPIISVFPDTISRLPASASCFLLLRAYGTEGEERSQLQNLSSPLLDHVRNSLTGKFGEADAIRAFDLLFSDVASHNADRRRCARRVFNDAIGKGTNEPDQVFASSNCSWMVNILHLEHCASILSDAIQYLTRAASFERGRILRFIVLALERLTIAAADKNLDGKWDFTGMLVELISNRPTVFAATMGSFPDLRSLAISLVHSEFKKYIEKSGTDEVDNGVEVEILLCATDEAAESVPANLPLSLLQCSCVLLSIWSEDDAEEGERSEAVDELVRMLMKPQDTDKDDDSKPKGKADGLASARFTGSGKSAIPVESWVMLARSRSDYIAKRAALTAPTGFLPRLLLCSGLPRASLLTMIDRLGKLGDRAPDQGKVFNQLLVPSAASEWDIGRLGHRREVSRKLLGRLSAYIRMYQLSKEDGVEHLSFTFLDWLTESCRNAEKPRKSKAKKARAASSDLLMSVDAAGSILGACTAAPLSSTAVDLLEGDAAEMTDFLSSRRSNGGIDAGQIQSSDEIAKFIDSAFEKNEVIHVQNWLRERTKKAASLKRKLVDETSKETSSGEIAYFLLKSFSDLERKTEGLGSCILKWVPKLSASSGSPDLWNALFLEGRKPGFMWSNLISRCIQCWSPLHVASCRTWLLSLGNPENLELRNVVFFLFHSTSLTSIHHTTLREAPGIGDDNRWMQSEKKVVGATRLALGCLKSLDDEVEDTKDRVCTRNVLPDSVALLLMISKYGKKQLQWVCQVVVEAMGKSEDSFRSILLAVVLRLYAYCPQSMNLGVAVLRAVLIEAVEEYAMVWLDWRSPLDDQFKDMIDAVVCNGAPPRLVQGLAEGSKKHPLLLLRQLDYMCQALEADAAVSGFLSAQEGRGVLSGQSLSGPLPAKVDGKLVRVNVKHWGFNYTENIWISFLEIVATVPKEVLFGCGLKMGLLDLLGVYLRLMFVQSQLRTSEKVPRLKNKLAEFFEGLKGSNRKGWESWLGSSISGLPSLGATRNVLMSCDFISHQQAIDSVKGVSPTSMNGAETKPRPGS